MTLDEARDIAMNALHEVNAVFDTPAEAKVLREKQGAYLLEEANLDSLGVVDWCMRLETQTGVDIDPGAFNRLKTLDELAAYIVQRAK